MNMEEEFTEEQAKNLLREFAEQKSNIHTFFTKVIQNEDTTRIGNLTEEELGMPKVPERTLKDLELFCKEVYGNNAWADYFNKAAGILTSTSLSKDAILLKLAVTNKKEVADMTPPRKKNVGWFKKNNQ